jgi:CheY-like chemotaxis protein/anti-sigma regulatory factor (Ser/Thr protein kinase)
MPGQRVLVVEDMPALREHVVETVAELGGVEVDSAADGAEALERIAAAPEPYALVLSDIIMPRLDGEGLLAELRQRRYPAAVVMLTALGQDDVVVRCLRAGACDYLVKPASIEDIHAAVGNALAHRPAGEVPIEVTYDPNGWFEVRGGSDPSVLYRYRKFLGLLERFHMPEPAASQVRLALEELGRNAIEWGNKGDPAKQVVLGCRILPGKVIVAIEDEGEGFDPGAVPDPSQDPLGHIENRKAQNKRLGGYGLHLIRNLMDKVVYNAKGNRVVAIKYLEAR